MTGNKSLQKHSRIYVAGHKGLVGSAICRLLRRKGYGNILTATRSELDLEDQAAVKSYFQSEKPEYVFLAAAKVGGINANNIYPAEFIHQNLIIQDNIIHQSWQSGVSKLLFLGSSCIYPRDCPQPMKEEYLLTGPLEKTNEWYAIAKIAGIKMCQAYSRQYGLNTVSVMPTNMYGPGDNFDLQNSHVLPALIRKFHDAKSAGRDEVELWGTGSPLREFLHVDDFADACLFLMNNYDSPEIINVGSGVEVTIKELAQIVREVIGFEGNIVFNRNMPDGTPRKLLDISRINTLGWNAEKKLDAGIAETYAWFLKNRS